MCISYFLIRVYTWNSLNVEYQYLILYYIKRILLKISKNVTFVVSFWMQITSLMRNWAVEVKLSFKVFRFDNKKNVQPFLVRRETFRNKFWIVSKTVFKHFVWNITVLQTFCAVKAILLFKQEGVMCEYYIWPRNWKKLES